MEDNALNDMPAEAKVWGYMGIDMVRMTGRDARGTFDFVYTDVDVNDCCREIIKFMQMKVKGNVEIDRRERFMLLVYTSVLIILFCIFAPNLH